MSTPLVSSRRITLTYVVLGLSHKHRHYAVNADSGGIRQVLHRDGTTVISWTDAAQALWDAIRQVLDNTVPAATALLEDRSGTLWLPTASATLSNAGQVSGVVNIASQITTVLRDTTFKKIRSIVLEHDEGYVGHSATGHTISSAVTSMVSALDGTVVSPAETPFNWIVGRSENYILSSGAVAGVTLDSNDRIRRSRGVA
jgi:hypothetical protein